MSNRKRKASDEPIDNDTRMSPSPTSSPSLENKQLPPARTIKRSRKNLSGRSLALPRLLETLSPDDMRNLLQSICTRHPDIGSEVVQTAPRPSIASTLQVLNHYESAFQTSFPFGGRRSSDYAFNRVKQPLNAFLDALKDYTPHFLPPHETQPGTSLEFLDAVTNLVHRLPDWDSPQHNRHKHDAYEELAKAWALVIQEAAKRGGGIQLQIGAWDQKIAKHNEMSGARMEEAVRELRNSLGWMGSGGGPGSSSSSGDMLGPNDPNSIRQQLLNGTYGMDTAVRVGPW